MSEKMNGLQLSAVPLAYFITFTCYGTWLHGEEKLSVDRLHNTFGTNFLTFNKLRKIIEYKQMTEGEYLLEKPHRQIVLNTIKQVCSYRSWKLYAAHVRTNHVHFVISAEIKPEVVMNTIKAYASRHLNAAKLDEWRNHRWTKHGSTRYLWKSEDVVTAVQYVVYEQGKPMAVFKDEQFIAGIESAFD